MASRQEEKQRRRAEREAAEQAAREQEARQKRLRTFGGIGLIAVGVAAAVLAIVVAGGSSKGTGNPKSSTTNVSGPAIPPQKTTDLTKAAAAAGCTLKSYHWTDADRNHVAPGTKVKYRTNPPSYGDHYPSPASDGDYVGVDTPATGYLVHALEHGRIEIQYHPGLPKRDIAQLERYEQSEKAGQFDADQYELIFENHTGMPYQVAATAWAKTLTCPKFNQSFFDALSAFRVKYSQQGPEKAYTGRE